MRGHQIWGIADKKQQACSHGMLNPSGDSPPATTAQAITIKGGNYE